MFSPTEMHLEVEVDQQLHTDLFIHFLIYWVGSQKAEIMFKNILSFIKCSLDLENKFSLSLHRLKCKHAEKQR